MNVKSQGGDKGLLNELLWSVHGLTVQLITDQSFNSIDWLIILMSSIKWWKYPISGDATVY